MLTGEELYFRLSVHRKAIAEAEGAIRELEGLLKRLVEDENAQERPERACVPRRGAGQATSVPPAATFHNS